MRDAVSFHDSLAQTWEKGYRKEAFSARLRVLSSLLPQHCPGQRWLDAGCGTGTLSRWLARERGFSVVAVDASEQMLRNASPEEGVNYCRGNVIKAGFADCSFDGVLCSSVLEYIPSIEAALIEFHRLLKPGGILVASVPNSALSVRIPLKLVYWLTRPLGRKRMYPFLDYSKHCYSMATFAELLQHAGFWPEHMIEFGDLGLPLMPAQFPRPLIMALANKIDTAHPGQIPLAAGVMNL
jgi:2-polyprenyl-6-hydroxyphenyl methylase/3-demethylubiquinone-9 3-methyltransferase